MPQRQEIITLDTHDQQTLDEVLSKMPIERLLRGLRHELHIGQQELQALRKAPTVTEEHARQVRDALRARAERLAKLPPDLVDSAQLTQALEPVHEGIRLCEQVLREFGTDLGDHEPESTSESLHAAL